MEEMEKAPGISRRRMLKRIGVGAAIGWSAPILTSLRVPAFAVTVSNACRTGFTCGGPFTVCNSTANPQCVCTTTTEGAACLADLCSGVGIGCTSNAQCQALLAGSKCQPAGTGCCGNQCIPACGTAGASSSQRNTQ